MSANKHTNDRDMGYDRVIVWGGMDSVPLALILMWPEFIETGF
jgi:protein-L-isoaspartate O-methyltransferase